MSYETRTTDFSLTSALLNLALASGSLATVTLSGSVTCDFRSVNNDIMPIVHAKDWGFTINIHGIELAFDFEELPTLFEGRAGFYSFHFSREQIPTDILTLDFIIR